MAATGTGERPTALVYRDFLLPFSETFIRAQAGALRRYAPVFVGRCEVAGICFDPGETELVDDGSRVGRLASLGYRAGFVPSGFLNRVRQREPVLLHAHFGPDALNAQPLVRRLGLPLVVTFHGYDAANATAISSGILQYRYGRRRPGLADHADRILAVSEFIRSKLLGLGMPEGLVKTHRIGVDTARFSPAGLESRTPIVLAVGRFVEHKGFEYLIDAISLVQRANFDVELVLIGAGPNEAKLRARAESKLRRFSMPGVLPPAAVAGWMQRARVMVVPSVTAHSGAAEGLGMTGVEALASGLPVVGSDLGGIPEVVVEGETGLLVPERDVERLADRIKRLLDDDGLWARLAAGARAHAVESFDLERQTAALEEDIYAPLH